MAINIDDPNFGDLNKVTAETRELLMEEDEFLTLVTGVKTVSPYSVLGAAIPQVHVSPVENIRVSGAPNVDIQFTLSDNDNGVPHG